MASISTAIRAPESRGTGEGAVESNGGHILAVTGTLMGITFVVVSLRLYVRQVLLRSFSIDDAVILVALIMAIMSMVCFIGMVQHGAGRYPKDIKDEWKEGLAYWSFIIGEFLVTGISLVKISIGFVLKRFAQSPAQHRFLCGIILFCSVFMAYSAIAFTIACVPLRAMWVPGLRAAPTTKCQSPQTLSIIGTVNGVCIQAVNVLTDLIFCLLPVPVVLALRINRRTKATLFLILSFGLFACAASIARMIFGRRRLRDPYYTRQGSSPPQSTDKDKLTTHPRRHYNFLIWFYIELQVGILAASLPTLRPLFTKLLKDGPRAVLSGGNSKYGSMRYWGRLHLGDRSIPMDTINMPGRYYHGSIDNNDSNNNNNNGYYMAQISSTTHTRNSADGGGIRVSKRTEIMFNEEDKDFIEGAGAR
ncbi:oxidoreductase [Apiospora hydei]|uniref:Oxidoreductase n=1 Tax=Apiospora hydei TaxID=1337664 RepID=A0ABR1VTF1_9PEZI